MAIYKNKGSIPRILLTETGDYTRLTPGMVSANIKLDMTNPVMTAYLDSGNLIEVKPKKSKPKVKSD